MLLLSIYLNKIGYVKTSILYLMLFFTSINHWKNPSYEVYDAKRILDISMVIISISKSIIYINKIEYNLVVLYTLILFYFSKFFDKNNKYLSVLLHSKIHLTCLIGNAYFYTHKNN
jgi:hypothetical protein